MKLASHREPAWPCADPRPKREAWRKVDRGAPAGIIEIEAKLLVHGHASVPHTDGEIGVGNRDGVDALTRPWLHLHNVL